MVTHSIWHFKVSHLLLDGLAATTHLRKVQLYHMTGCMITANSTYNYAGLEQQTKRIPLSFFIEQIVKDKRIVLTGTDTVILELGSSCLHHE